MSALDQVRDTFFQECEELLEELQEGLLAIQTHAAEDETIHSVFRAVHSIKGGAGAFGFDHLVRFAHEFETLLDAVRNGTVDAEGDIVGVLLVACDRLGDLVIAAREGSEADAAETDTLIAKLLEYIPNTGDSNADSAEALPEFAPLTLSLDLGDPEPAAGLSQDMTTTFLIRFRPQAALYRNGNETVLLLRALSDLGETQVSCDTSQLPELDALDPEESYLGWNIRLMTTKGEPEIREVFDFVDGVCELDISRQETDADVPTTAAAPTMLPLAPPEIAPPPQPVPTPPQIAAPEPQDAETGSPAAKPAPPRSPPKPAIADKPTAPAVTVRVDVIRIDRLINLVGELVMNQAMLAQSVSELNVSAASEFATGLDELKQLSREIQDSVMAIRAQPVKSLFQRMSRIVREAAAATGKSVHLDISGEMTEVDKTVIEKLADPLTHMIRNAVDHGVETPEARAIAGKSDVGTIRLSAAHRSGRIVIEVTDDGAGVNRERVQQIAVEKGIISAADQLSVEEIDALLFRPGFSTVGKVSKLSGRGVGMDVVNSAIRALSGRIAIKSQPGEGSTFSVSLPLTLAVLDGMVVEVEEQMLVIPITSIIEMLRPEGGNVHAMSHDSNVIFVRDTYVPVLDVGHILGYREKLAETGDCIFLLVENDNGARCAMLVDAIHNQRQVVIKGLEKNYGKVPGIAAATVLGDGRIALILDPNDDLFAGGSATPVTDGALAATG